MLRHKRQENMLNALSSQLDLFEALKIYHEVWADEAHDIKIEHIHREIIDLMRQNPLFYSICTNSI